MVLHQPDVPDAAVGGDGVVDADATFRFLHDDCEDEAGIDFSGCRDGLNGAVELFGLVGGIVVF